MFVDRNPGYCSYNFREKLSKDLGLDEHERRGFELAFYETIKGKNPYSETQVSSLLTGNAYVDWCSMDKKTRDPWSVQLEKIQQDIEDKLELLFRDDQAITI